jgi:hypothetical protein
MSALDELVLAARDPQLGPDEDVCFDHLRKNLVVVIESVDDGDDSLEP